MSIQAELPNGGRAETPIYDGLREEWPSIWAKHEVDKVLQAKADREHKEHNDDGQPEPAGEGSTTVPAREDGVGGEPGDGEPESAPVEGDALDG